MKYSFFTRGRCPHSDLKGIYGDAINFYGGYRLMCMDCGDILDGPVRLAKIREKESEYNG